MKYLYKLFFTIIFSLLSFTFFVKGQIIDPVKWEISTEVSNDKEAVLIFKAKIDKPWHIYAQEPNGGLNPTTFTFIESPAYERVGNVTEPGNFLRKHDTILNVDYNLYSHEIIFKQKIHINSKEAFEVKGNINYFSCDDQKCLPPKDEEFTISINPAPKGNKTLLALFLISFLGGLGALLTPCVYPIIPLTISYFMKSSGENKGKSVTTGIIFSLSIIFIYTTLGLIMGLLQIDLTGSVASHWLANSIFFLIFLIFAFSFYGMFELVLPGSWANSVDAKADKGGLIGTFFMALATVIISFSCTGPIIGVLIGKSLQGEILQPVVGMFSFSLAFSLPFPVLAIFPNLVKNMPKSGGWMNSVKVFFAFILLAFSMKFLHNIDKVLHWNIITRELFISVWIVLAFLLGLYFLGKIKFSHDSDLPYITVPRFILALGAFTFSIYLVTGLFGADLKGLSAILPEKVLNNMIQTVQLNMVPKEKQSTSTINILEKEICGTPKYSDILHLPHGLTGYFSIKEGIACAKEQNKPVFLDFKGHVCTNCKEMEQKVWSDPRILQRLRDHYIIIGLFTDDRTRLPESKWYVSKIDGKVKKSLGKQNLDYQIEKFGTNTIPYYVLVDHEENILTEPRGHNLDVEAFIRFLDEGVEKFNEKKQKPQLKNLFE